MASSISIPDAGTPAGQQAELVIFRLAGRAFALALSAVREIIPARPGTRVPGAPAHVAGLLNVRGTIVTLVDLGERLGVGSSAHAEASVLLVELGARSVGVLVDDVIEIGAIEPDDSIAGDAGMGGVTRALGRLGEEIVVVLDLERLIGQILL